MTTPGGSSQMWNREKKEQIHQPVPGGTRQARLTMVSSEIPLCGMMGTQPREAKPTIAPTVPSIYQRLLGGLTGRDWHLEGSQCSQWPSLNPQCCLCVPSTARVPTQTELQMLGHSSVTEVGLMLIAFHVGSLIWNAFDVVKSSPGSAWPQVVWETQAACLGLRKCLTLLLPRGPGQCLWQPSPAHSGLSPVLTLWRDSLISHWQIEWFYGDIWAGNYFFSKQQGF